MDIHFGSPKNMLVLRFLSTTVSYRSKGRRRRGHNVYRESEITWWLGLSWRGRFFFGLMSTGPQTTKDEPLTAGELRRIAAATDKVDA